MDQGKDKPTGRMDGNQGEGNREAAKAYNKGAHDTARTGAVRAKAEQAKHDLDSPEGDALRAAEKEGRSHAKGEDPALKR